MNGPLSASANERHEMPTAARAPRRPQTSRNFPSFSRETASETASGLKSGRSEPILSRRSVALFVPEGENRESAKIRDPPSFLGRGSVTYGFSSEGGSLRVTPP